MRVSFLPPSVSDRWPILSVLFCSTSAYALLVFAHRGALAGSGVVLAPFLIGVVYTHFFEYGYHRLLMHAGARGLGFIKKNHLKHHQVFYGENFTSRDHSDWQYISSPWFVFPALVAIHYAVLRAFFTPRWLLAFFAGVLLHYLVFECTHWMTHVEGNLMDRWIAKVPGLRRMRAYHIRHHRYHHEIPVADFNFNPPFLGDVVFRTLEVPPADPR